LYDTFLKSFIYYFYLFLKSTLVDRRKCNHKVYFEVRYTDLALEFVRNEKNHLVTKEMSCQSRLEKTREYWLIYCEHFKELLVIYLH